MADNTNHESPEYPEYDRYFSPNKNQFPYNPNRHRFIPQTCPNKQYKSRKNNVSNPPHSERVFDQNRMQKPAYFEDLNVNNVEIKNLKLEKERKRKQNDRKK